MHVIACVLIHTLMHMHCVHVGGYGAMRLCACGWIWCHALVCMWVDMVPCACVHVGGYGSMRLCASNLCVVHIYALLAFESCMCNDVYSCATCFVEMQ